MVDSERPWEPPLAGTEVEHLLGALDRLRATFRWKADGLDSAGLQTRIGASSLTLGGLLKHLFLVEDYMFTSKLSGEPIGAPWDATESNSGDDWEFTSSSADSPQQLYAHWDGAVERSRARLADALADGGLDQLVHVSGPDGRHASLRRLVWDLIEEYGRHADERFEDAALADESVGEAGVMSHEPRSRADEHLRSAASDRVEDRLGDDFGSHRSVVGNLDTGLFDRSDGHALVAAGAADGPIDNRLSAWGRRP